MVSAVQTPASDAASVMRGGWSPRISMPNYFELLATTFSRGIDVRINNACIASEEGAT